MLKDIVGKGNIDVLTTVISLWVVELKIVWKGVKNG